MTYNVEYYQENLNGEFEKVATDKKTDKTNSHVEAEEKSFPGFTLDKTVE